MKSLNEVTGLLVLPFGGAGQIGEYPLCAGSGQTLQGGF
jgi:hypothetical protein